MPGNRPINWNPECSKRMKQSRYRIFRLSIVRSRYRKGNGQSRETDKSPSPFFRVLFRPIPPVVGPNTRKATLPSSKVLGGVSSSTSTSTSTTTATEAETNVYDNAPSPRRGDYLNKMGDYFVVHRSLNLSHRSLNLSQVSALSTGSYLKDQALAAQADNEIQPRKFLQSALFARRLPVDDDFDSDEEESKAPAPKAILCLPECSSDTKLEPITSISKSTTDVSQETLSKGRSEQEQIRAMLDKSPPADQRKGSKKEKSSPAQQKGSKKMKILPDPNPKQQKQKKDPPESVEETQPRQRHSKRSTKAVRKFEGEVSDKDGNDEGLRSCSVTVDTELTHCLSHNSHSTGGEEEAHIAHHLPKLHANHHHNNKKKIDGWLKSGREKMGETGQGKNHHPLPCHNILVSSPPLQLRPKMFFRSLSVGNRMMYNLDDNDGFKNNNHRNNSEEVEDGKGAFKLLSVRRQLVAANPPPDFTRPHLRKSYGGSLSLRDVTTTRPSFNTSTSPQRLRRGKKPATKHILLSPLATPTLRSPPNRRDHHRDPKTNKDTRHRSASCDPPLDRRHDHCHHRNLYENTSRHDPFHTKSR